MKDNWIKIIDPNYINAEMIGPVGAEVVVTIEDIDERDAFNPRTNKTEKVMALICPEYKPAAVRLNKTNRKTLFRLFGNRDPKECIGEQIVLYVENVSVGGNQTTGIRIKEYSALVCEECGAKLKAAAGKQPSELAEISKRNTGKVLCLDCMKKAKEAENNG